MQLMTKCHKETTGSLFCIVINGPTLNEAREQIRRGSAKADLLEFRLDQFAFSHIEAIAHLKNAASVPVIFTIRKRSHGGEYRGDEQQRLEEIRRLLTLSPEYLDLEFDVSLDFFEEIESQYPQINVICSFHDFEQTPKDLQAVFEMMKIRDHWIYKIATMANSTLDAMRILRFVKENSRKGFQIIAIGMGENGKITRILGPIFGSVIVFSSLTNENVSAPGQLNYDELVKQYHLKKHSKDTLVLGLIGDPINKSPSHFTHNYAIKLLGLNAVYVKFCVSPQELSDFLELAKKLNFSGFSVTMPLKELIINYLQKSEVGREIGAINTLRMVQKNFEGINTDGIGAIDAIEEIIQVKDKKLVILGAGGAARAIAWEAVKRGAQVVILNRTIEKAEKIANELQCQFGSLNDFPAIAAKGYDVLINSTSVGMYSEKTRLPIDCSHMLENKIALDVIPGWVETPFLHEAKNKHCFIIYGNQMLMNQAIEQFHFWFGNSIDKEKIREALKEGFNNIGSS